MSVLAKLITGDWVLLISTNQGVSPDWEAAAVFPMGWAHYGLDWLQYVLSFIGR